MASTERNIRSGLPRVPGGVPWPPQGVARAAASVIESSEVATPIVAPPASEPIASYDLGQVPPREVDFARAHEAGGSTPVVSGVTLRRGLPRVAGGEPWPAADATAPAVVPKLALPEPASLPAPEPVVEAVPASPAPGEPVKTPAAVPAEAHTPVVRERRRVGSRPLSQWIRFGVWGVIGAILAAGIIVLAARGVTTLPGVPEFMRRYPGEYAAPEIAEPGFPIWARWNHFLNLFLIVLIIRSGLLVRQQKQPPAFWTPKRGGKKISINLWLHTSLDVLWVLNGAVFVVLLFVSGHWARIVPTSWEVFPNAASALLQYLTLEWPAEHGWVNYNSLQQLMYFIVVFIAAPLAIITGVRMSEWWPTNAEKLNKLYPAPIARALHFPTMLFFVLFIIVHVFLVFTTGALRNLNHMFAGSDAVNWVGFWWFAAGIFVTVAAVFLARPLVIAPIASLTGRVSNR